MQQQGISMPEDDQWDALQDIVVGNAMTTEYPSVHPEAILHDPNELFLESGHHGFPVVDDEQKLVGIITVSDLKLVHPNSTQAVADIATSEVLVAYLDQSLQMHWHSFGAETWATSQ
tara:strand:- start:48 stop:398 length:351 start_codon:yes stop_codon:yes gene_type:complete